MAVLSADELTWLRQQAERIAVSKGVSIDYVKSQIEAAVQAIEDRWEGDAAGYSSAIDTATSPFVFTNQQKKVLGSIWLRQKADREEVLV